MSTIPIVLKNSNQPSKVPSLNDLMYGEIAVNTYDGKIFIKVNNGTEQIITFSASSDMSGYVPTSRTITAGTGLTGGGNLSANRTLNVSYGTTSGTAAQGNDSRINNGQTAFGWGNHASAGYALDSVVAKIAGTTMTGLFVTRTVVNPTFGDGGDQTISVRGSATMPATMTFHRTGAYAVHFGLDTDNKMKVGGWSMGVGVNKTLAYEDGVYSRAGAGGNITINSANPSGGNNGDIWFKV